MFAYCTRMPGNESNWTISSWTGRPLLVCVTYTGDKATCSRCDWTPELHKNAVEHPVKLNIMSSRRIGGWTSRDLYYISFRWEGRIWTGTTHGPGIYLRARITKRRDYGRR